MGLGLTVAMENALYNELGLIFAKFRENELFSFKVWAKSRKLQKYCKCPERIRTCVATSTAQDAVVPRTTRPPHVHAT